MFKDIPIEDHSIWFKHVADPRLRTRLENMAEDEQIILLTDGVVGKWRRMKTGRDGRKVCGIKPEGAMKQVWNEWFKTRKGESVAVTEVSIADDYLAAGTTLFSEWNSDEDEMAFHDL